MIKCNTALGCPKDKDICCTICDEVAECDSKCDVEVISCGFAVIDEESGLVLFQQKQVAVLQEIAGIITSKKILEETEKELKAKLLMSMESCGIKKFTSDILNITYVAETTATSVDSKKLKEKHPKIFKECSKTSNKSAYVKVEVK